MNANILPYGIPSHPLDTREEAEASQETLVMHGLCEAVPYLCKVSKGRVPKDELLSMSYAGLVKAAKNFKAGGVRFFGYAKVYLRSELSKYWRDQDPVKNASVHEDKELSSAPALTPTVEEPPFELIDIKERWDIIKPLLREKLTDRERMVLELTHIGGYSFTQIAKLVVPTVSREAIRICHLRAIKRLRFLLTRKSALL